MHEMTLQIVMNNNKQQDSQDPGPAPWMEGKEYDGTDTNKEMGKGSVEGEGEIYMLCHV